MKTKKEVLTSYLETAEETLLKINIRMEYVNKRHGEEQKQSFLRDLAELTADKKETENWVEFLKEEISKEK